MSLEQVAAGALIRWVIVPMWKMDSKELSDHRTIPARKRKRLRQEQTRLESVIAH